MSKIKLTVALLFCIFLAYLVITRLNSIKISPDHIEITNRIKLTFDPGVKVGHFVLFNVDMKEMQRHWHLIGGNNPFGCSYLAKLVMKDGNIYTIDNLSVERYLTNSLKIPIVNTTDGRTIKCY